MLLINELFLSVQGEGVRTGCQSIFVRLAACNLAIGGHPCRWCDTSYAWAMSQGESIEVYDLIDQIDCMSLNSGVKEVVLTGGEPLYHLDSRLLIEELVQKYLVTIQTNGTMPIWDTSATWATDIKCPSSGNDGYNLYNNLRVLKDGDQIKFVISDRQDFEFAKTVLSKVRRGTVLFQPAWKTMDPETMIHWVQEDKLSRVRISTQTHKYWFGDKRKGV